VTPINFKKVKPWTKKKTKEYTEADITPIPRSDIITIDLPASAIVFTEDDGTPMRETVAVKQSNIKYIEWDFSFGDFAAVDNFHIHKLPIAGARELLPISILKPTSYTLPYPKTESGKQYYCIMVKAESDKPSKSIQEIMICAIGNYKVTDTPTQAIRTGNNEAVLDKGSIISAAIGHSSLVWEDHAHKKIHYLVQIVLEPSKLTYL